MFGIGNAHVTDIIFFFAGGCLFQLTHVPGVCLAAKTDIVTIFTMFQAKAHLLHEIGSG